VKWYIYIQVDQDSHRATRCDVYRNDAGDIEAAIAIAKEEFKQLNRGMDPDRWRVIEAGIWKK
jgi:hypothetical protein